MHALLDFSLVMLLSAAASSALILLLKPLLVRYALARPNARSSHTTPTPQGGGIAVVIATAVGVLVAAALSMVEPGAMLRLWPLAAAVALLATAGALDDLFHLPVVPRLALQAVAVAAVLVTLPAEARIVPLLPWWLERAALLVGGVYFVNLVNFMDGIDWMTVAEAVPVTGALVALSLVGALSPREGAIAAALLGASIGFAPFNRPVAKLFLGDVTQAHRTHFYQRATDLGFSVPEIVGRVFAANLVLAALAIASVSASPWVRAAALALGAAVVAALLVHLARPRR